MREITVLNTLVKQYLEYQQETEKYFIRYVNDKTANVTNPGVNGELSREFDLKARAVRSSISRLGFSPSEFNIALEDIKNENK